MTAPYIQNPETGKSATREFLVRFLTSIGGPSADDCGRTLPAIMASIYSPAVAAKESLYTAGRRDTTKRYVGRASKIASSKNPDENVWCMIADVQNACRRLDFVLREVLVLRYVYDCSDYDIANALNLTLDQVSTAEESAIEQLASYLDGGK